MRRCVAAPGFGLWRWQSGIGRHFEPAAGSVPYALATNARQGAPLGAVLRPACTPTSSQSPCPASPASQPGSRSHSFVALLGAGALQRRRPATLAPACNATTAAAATTCRPAGPGSDAAPACDLGPQHRNGGGSPSRADKQLQTQHLNSSTADSSGSSSWSGQVQASYEENDGNGGGTGRQAQGGATLGQAAESVQLPPPHSGLEVRAWGRGAPPLRPGRLQVWWTPLDLATTCSPASAARNRGCITPAEAAEVAASKSAEVAAKRTAARALARTVLARAVGGALAEEGSSSGGSSGGSSGISSTRGSAGACVGASGAHSASNGNGDFCMGNGNGNGYAAAITPQDLRFARNGHGKPHLVPGGTGWPVLRHNLTHTHDLAGVAVLREPGHCSAAADAQGSGTSSTVGSGGGGGGRVVMSVGLDVERLDRAPRDPMALARRRLAPAEVRDLEAITDLKQRARHFMWLWTLKEAYVKARGTGINAPPGLKGFAIGFREMLDDQRLAVQAVCGASQCASPRLTAITITHCAAGAATSAAATPPPVTASASTPSAIASRVAGTGHAAASGSGTCATVAAAAAAAACGSRPGAAAALPSSQAAPAPPQPLPDADVGTDAQFHFLLFQPTPAHVGALCIATQQLSPAAAAAARGDNSDNIDGAGIGSVGSSNRGSGSRGTSGGGAGTCWAALVDHWWCVPLEGEAQLSSQQLTLLGCTMNPVDMATPAATSPALAQQC